MLKYREGGHQSLLRMSECVTGLVYRDHSSFFPLYLFVE